MISFLLLSYLLLRWYRERERMWTSRLCTLRSVPYCSSRTETHHENPQDLQTSSSTYVYSYTPTWYLKSSRVFVTLASSMHLMQRSLSTYERGSWRQWESYGIVRWHRRPLEDPQDPQGESRSGESDFSYLLHQGSVRCFTHVGAFFITYPWSSTAGRHLVERQRLLGGQRYRPRRMVELTLEVDAVLPLTTV